MLRFNSIKMFKKKSLVKNHNGCQINSKNYIVYCRANKLVIPIQKQTKNSKVETMNPLPKTANS